jgi:hypothetical protein
MKIKIIIIATLILFGSSLLANEIYIEQVGDTLDLDIIQDGQNNEIGDSTKDAMLSGDSMTFAITQTGDTNKIDAIIDGSTYTGTWAFTGDSNNVDMKCDSTNGVNCDNVTVNITTTGDDNTFDIFVGETNDAQNLVAAFTIDGDGNVIQAEVDGTNADVTVTVDNSSTTSSTTLNDVASGNSTDAGGNLIDIDISGDGDSGGHAVTLDITGGGNLIDITQSGINDNKVNLEMTGDNGSVNINQFD